MARRRTDQPFLEEVRRLMNEKDFTLRGLAHQAGIDPGFLVRVLQGKKPLSHNVRMLITQALDLPEDYFLESRLEMVTDAMLGDTLLVDALYDVMEEIKKTDSST